MKYEKFIWGQFKSAYLKPWNNLYSGDGDGGGGNDDDDDDSTSCAVTTYASVPSPSVLCGLSHYSSEEP